MDVSARGEFEVQLAPGESLLPGAGRFDFTKTWSGDLTGTSSGVMLSAGSAAAGAAGYVALEVVTATLGERAGSFALQQFGTMTGESTVLTYLVTPGSGTGGFAGVAGEMDLVVDDDGTHHYTLTLQVPEAG